MSSPSARAANGDHLDFLDGLRGLSALYVVLFHFWQTLVHYGPLPSALSYGVAWMSAGRSAVTVFIVLSGFCLMLPVARAGGLRGGVGGFLRRRARRILPPYYAALLLCLVLLPLVAGLLRQPEVFGCRSLPFWEPGVVVSHLLLCHNLSGDWVFKVNIPMWSVATEWQIYFAFALVLLPVWRRAGTFAMVALAVGLGLLPWLVAPCWNPAGPWLLGCFALGMAAAVRVASRPAKARARDRVPWFGLTVLGGAAVVAVMAWCLARGVRAEDPNWPGLPLLDFLVAATAACGILACARRGPGAGLRSLLEARWCVGLGAFSYSLYLTHGPLVCVLDAWAFSVGYGVWQRLVFFVMVGVPVCLVVGHMFYLVYERPLLAAPHREEAPAAGFSLPVPKGGSRQIRCGLS